VQEKERTHQLYYNIQSDFDRLFYFTTHGLMLLIDGTVQKLTFSSELQFK
jgi:hypothetical protein